MSQVIEVRLYNPNNLIEGKAEKLYDGFTQASSHREAIELALSTYFGEFGVLKEEIRKAEDEPGTFIKGSAPCWRYAYWCVLEDPDNKDVGRELAAVLFAQYKEKEEAPHT